MDPEIVSLDKSFQMLKYKSVKIFGKGQQLVVLK